MYSFLPLPGHIPKPVLRLFFPFCLIMRRLDPQSFYHRSCHFLPGSGMKINKAEDTENDCPDQVDQQILHCVQNTDVQIAALHFKNLAGGGCTG